MQSPSIYETGDSVLASMNALCRVVLSDTSVEVRCSEKCVVFAERCSLIATSGFFESMLALKPTKKEAVVDMTSFCADEKTLSSLVQFATLNGVISFQWNVTTIANMLFLVDPLQLTKIVQDCLFENISAVLWSQETTNIFILAVHDVILQRQPTEVEIEKILTMLNALRSTRQTAHNPARLSAALVKHQNDQQARMYQYCRSNHYEQYPPIVFVPPPLPNYDMLTSLIILSLWMKLMSSTLVFAKLAKIQAVFDVKIGNSVPSTLLTCNDVVPGMLYWVKLIYACGEGQ